ncbi:MAG: YqeG family HAD IIIA-type phosphatase [Clostridium sp.]|nr:YqeG family HAD IIIA-type phosphatase [Clostridium sp.]
MLKKFYPDLKLKAIGDVDLDFLARKNIKGIILDIDNTLVPEHVKRADKKVLRWIEKVKNMGFKLCIVSNASHKRVSKFNENLGLHAVHKASKPRSRSFIRAMDLMNTKPMQTAVIGDQIFTDIYGGNKLGIFTILVNPIDKKEIIGVRLKRILEGIILTRYQNNLQRSKNK